MRKNEAIWIEKNNRWQIKVQKDCKRKTFYSTKPGVQGKIEAERKADDWLETSGDPQTIRFNKLCAMFLEEKRLLKGKSSSDLSNHEYAIRCYLLPEIGYKKTNFITLKDWQECINNAYKNSQIKGHPLSAKSLKNIRASMTAIYSFAVKNNIPLMRPEFIVIPKSAPVGQRKILAPEDIKVIFENDTFGERKFWYINLVRFLLLSGLRPGEALAIRPKTDIKDGIINISRSVNIYGEITDGKNSNAKRTLAISPTMQEIIDKQKAMLKENKIISPWLFPDQHGELSNAKKVYSLWVAYRDYHHLTPCSLYELRHTMVSVVKNAIPEHLLKMILGHSETMDTYGIYGHKYNSDLELFAKATEKAYNDII